MAHDEGGLGVGLARLVQEFDRGHLAAAFALFQAISQDDEPPIAALDAGMDLQDQPGPHAGETIGTEGRAVEEIQQAAVAAAAQAQGPHEACDAGQVPPGAEGGQDEDEPEEGAPARTRRTQLRHHRPPMEPE